MKQALVICFVVVPALFLGGIMATDALLVEEYARFAGPGGRYAIIVHRHPSFFAAPGQGSDAPGTIVLVGPAGKVIRRTPVKMVQLVSPPVWAKGRVAMKLLFDWKLPE